MRFYWNKYLRACPWERLSCSKPWTNLYVLGNRAFH